MLHLRLSGVKLIRFVSSNAVASIDGHEEQPIKKISKALETYIRLSKEHGSMMARERANFELGRRHLANIMNLDSNSMTQADVDEAIKYLFPSSLFDLKARPVMRPPDEILPKFHRIAFDEEGRPEGTRFYTLLPKFYGLLTDIGVKTKAVTSFYNDHLKTRRNSEELKSVNVSGTQWLSQQTLEKKLEEKINEEMYTHLLMAFDHLVSLPSSAVEKKFIMQYRQPLTATTKSRLFGPNIPNVTTCPITQCRMTSVRTRCKDTRAEVQVLDPGVGKFDIDGHDLCDFRQIISRRNEVTRFIYVDISQSTSNDTEFI